MTMRIGSRFLAAGLFGLAAFAASPKADAAGAGAIGGGFGPSAFGGAAAVGGRGGFVGGVPYGYRGHHHHGWRGAYGYGYGRHHGRWGHGRYGYGRYGYGYGVGGYGFAAGYVYGGGAYPVEPPPPVSRPLVGIPPSPVAPPAIYVIGPKAKGAVRRKSAKSGLTASSYSVAGQSSGVVVTRVTPAGYRMN